MSDTPRTDAEAFLPHDSKYRVCDVDFVRQLERELNAANERIKRVIAERDTARRQADQNYKLREEFTDLLGTDDVERGVAVVRELKDRTKRLEKAGDDLESWLDRNTPFTIRNNWREAKEAKP